MGKIGLLSKIGLFFVAAVLFCSTNSLSQPKIKIGVSAPLSGNEATFGQDVQDTVRFANEHLTGGKYEIIFEDDRCNGKDVVSAANKLTRIDKVSASIVVCSGAILGGAPIYEKAKTVAISPYASSPDVSNAGDYIFRTWPSDVAAGEMLASYAAGKYTKIGVLTEQTQYTVGLEEAFVKAKDAKLLKLTREQYLTGDRDLRSILLKIKSRKVEALFINSQSEQTFLNALQQARTVGLNVPVLGAYIPGSPSFLKAVSLNVDGIVYVDSPGLLESLTSEGKRLYDQYVKEYGEPNGSPFLFATTLEAFRVLHKALSSNRSPKEYLYKTSFDGIVGRYSFDHAGDIQGINLSLYKLKDKKPVLLP